jgi:flavin-dependent dehydrogenase
MESAGLGHLLRSAEATALTRLDLAAGGRRVSLQLPAGVAISRLHFDAELVKEAVHAGAEFVSGTTAIVRGLADRCRFRSINLQHEDRSARARARMVIVADGLGRTSLKHHRRFAAQVAAASRIGLGATMPASPSDIEAGCVLMSVARTGYVGMVRVPGDGLNLAAAIDPNVVRQHGPTEAVRHILNQAGVPVPNRLDTVEWRGTGLLTRRSSRLSARRLLLLGDAAGYVEPFTGEGMTWGMLSAILAAPWIDDWMSQDRGPTADCIGTRQEFDRLARSWSDIHRTHIAFRQRDCRWLSRLLRSPAAVRVAMALIPLAPPLTPLLVARFWNSGKGAEMLPRGRTRAGTRLG